MPECPANKLFQDVETELPKGEINPIPVTTTLFKLIILPLNMIYAPFKNGFSVTRRRQSQPKIARAPGEAWNTLDQAVPARLK